MLLAGAGTALALMALIVVTTARDTPILHAPDRDPNLHISYGTYRPPTLPGGASGTPTSRAATNTHTGNVVGTVMLYILLALLVLGLLWILTAVVASVIRRVRQRRRVAEHGTLPEVDDAVADAVAEAVRRQESLVHEGTPSNAIVACWVDLEQSVAAAGVERRPSETSAELTLRVLDTLDVDRRSLRTLSALYREARYSPHQQLTERDRTAARDALRALRLSLPAPQERV